MAYGKCARFRKVSTSLSSFEPPMPKNFRWPPKLLYSRWPTRRYSSQGVWSRIQESTRLFSMVGTTLVRYTFSMISGTEQMIIGLTFFIAASRMDGVGGRWM